VNHGSPKHTNRLVHKRIFGWRHSRRVEHGNGADPNDWAQRANRLHAGREKYFFEWRRLVSKRGHRDFHSVGRNFFNYRTVGGHTFFNNFIVGPSKPANYSQPNVSSPTPNPAVASTVGIPATTVTAEPPVQQPDYRKPSLNAEVASYPVGKNPLGVNGPQEVYEQPGQFGENGIPNRGLAIRGVIPAATPGGYYGQG
jgi:hypothetical protein